MKLFITLLLLLTGIFANASDYYIKSYISNNFTTTDLEGNITHYDKKTEIQVYVKDGQEHCRINLYQGDNLFDLVVLSSNPLTTKNEDEIMILHNSVEQREDGSKIVSLLSFHYDLAESRTTPSIIKFSPVFSGIYFNFLDIEVDNRLIGEVEKAKGYVSINNLKLKLPLKVVENPYNYSSKDQVRIFRICLFDDETIVDFYCNNYIDDDSRCEWYNINPKAYIKADGRKYELKKAENIALAPSKSFFDTSQKIDQKNFTLHFSAIPLLTETVDFIEDEESDWNIKNIGMNGYYCPQSKEQEEQLVLYHLKKKAEQGDVEAQYYLGTLYERGIGTAQDFQQAAFWYEKSAEQGNVNAQFNIANCYFDGKGVSQNYQKAIYWYKKAAEQEDVVAQYNLGSCYLDGIGVEKNYKHAVYWFKLAAEKGFAYAQCSLGLCYKYGYGVEQNFEQCVFWYIKAAEQGDAQAQFNLGNCYYRGEGVSQNMSEAKQWYKKAAAQGHKEAQIMFDKIE